MNSPKKKTSVARAAKRNSPRKAKPRKPAGLRPLSRRSDAIEDRIGYTGDRGDARSATSGIP